MLQVCRTRSDKPWKCQNDYLLAMESLRVISCSKYAELRVRSVRPSHPVLIRKLWVNRSYQTAAKHGNQLKVATLDYCCSCWSPSEIEPLSLSHDSPYRGVIMINSDNKDYWATLCEGPQLVLYENLRNQRVLRPSQVCSTRGDCTRRGKNIANTNIFPVLQCFWYW